MNPDKVPSNLPVPNSQTCQEYEVVMSKDTKMFGFMDYLTTLWDIELSRVRFWLLSRGGWRLNEDDTPRAVLTRYGSRLRGVR